MVLTGKVVRMKAAAMITPSWAYPGVSSLKYVSGGRYEQDAVTIAFVLDYINITSLCRAMIPRYSLL